MLPCAVGVEPKRSLKASRIRAIASTEIPHEPATLVCEPARDQRAQLSALAARSIRGVLQNWVALRRDLEGGERPKAHALGWMQTHDYLTLAARSLDEKVLTSLARYGIDLRPYLQGGDRGAAAVGRGDPERGDPGTAAVG